MFRVTWRHQSRRINFLCVCSAWARILAKHVLSFATSWSSSLWSGPLGKDSAPLASANVNKVWKFVHKFSFVKMVNDVISWPLSVHIKKNFALSFECTCLLSAILNSWNSSHWTSLSIAIWFHMRLNRQFQHLNQALNLTHSSSRPKYCWY